MYRVMQLHSEERRALRETTDSRKYELCDDHYFTLYLAFVFARPV